MAPDLGSRPVGDIAIVYAWEPESRRVAEALCSRDHFGITVRLVSGTGPDSLDLGAQCLVACVLFVSPKALANESFAAVVSQCSSSRLLRSDFRLFVWLTGGLTLDKLRELAHNGHPCSLLLESVHFPRHRTAATADVVADTLDQYLSELAEYRREAVARSIEHSMTAVALWSAGILMANGLLALLVAWFLGSVLVGGPSVNWLLFGMGQLTFYAVLSVVSVRTPARMDWAGSAIRACLIASAAFLFRVIPFDAIVTDWSWIGMGTLAAAIGDSAIRVSVGARRWNGFCEPHARDDHDSDSVPPPGTANWKLFFCGPLIPRPPRVFISYSESTDWSSRTAGELWHELRNHGIQSFYAPKCNPPGSSWRHRLREEISKCSSLLFVQDETLMSRKWPQAELRSGCAQQAKVGVPSVVVLRRPGAQVGLGLQNQISSCLSAVLRPAPVLSPGLAIVEYSPSQEENIVRDLADRWHDRERALLSGFRGRSLELAFAIPYRLLVILGRHSGFATLALLLSEAFVLAMAPQRRHEVASMAVVIFTLLTAYLSGWGLSSRVSVRLRQRHKRIIRVARHLRQSLMSQLIFFSGVGDSERALFSLHLRLLILGISEAPMLVLVSPLVKVCAALVFALGWIVEVTDDETVDWRYAVSLE